MELTGKCKEDFEKWLNDHDEYRSWLLDHRITIKNFERIVPFSMQWGVLLEFFDSVGIRIYLVELETGAVAYDIEPIQLETVAIPVTITTRKQAQIEAVKQFNKLYNER